MKALVLAAGRGTRLGDLTKDKPKAVLQVGSRPILDYILHACQSVDVEELVLVVGYREKVLRDHVGEGQEWGFEVSYVTNPKSRVTENAYSVFLAREQLQRRRFLLVNADTLFHPGIAVALTERQRSRAILAVDMEKKLGREEMKVIVDGSQVTEISKELEPQRADGEYIGVALVQEPRLFYESLAEALREQGPQIYYEEAFAQMARSGISPYAESTKGLPWIEVDTPDDLREARTTVAPLLATSIEEGERESSV
ncbi:MAG: sugar phosphate nucleotidyltransferase [Thermoplasmata archaeon]